MSDDNRVSNSDVVGWIVLASLVGVIVASIAINDVQATKAIAALEARVAELEKSK